MEYSNSHSRDVVGGIRLDRVVIERDENDWINCITENGVFYVGCSQKRYHFGRPPSTTAPESILVVPNALHFVLRAFGTTRMCHAYGTSGALQIARVVPNEVVTDSFMAHADRRILRRFSGSF
jgi:hypothetical protein